MAETLQITSRGGAFMISKNVSLALKGISAICLICTHWCTYNLHLIENTAFTSFIPLHLGHFCIIIFMFLSGYGVTKVEINRYLPLKEYIFNRIWKILKPAWMISLITLILYIIFGPRNISMEVVDENWLHIYMSQISHRAFSVWFFFKYFVLHLDWYVATTIVLYLILWISLKISHKARIIMIVLYIEILILYLIGFYFNIPGHYYRNLWSFPFGVACALYPQWIRNKSILLIVGITCSLNAIIEGIQYSISTIMALSIIIIVGFTNVRYETNSRFLIYLGGISYPIYLIHRTVYNLQWTYEVLYFPLFILITVLASILYKYIIGNGKINIFAKLY